MTTKAKTTGSRYTEDQTTEMVEAYTSADSAEAREAVVTAYATKFEFPAASIRGKLSSAGVYIAKAASTKNGGPIVRKDQLVSQIAKLMGKDEEVVGSLEKVTKPVLQDLITALTANKE